MGLRLRQRILSCCVLWRGDNKFGIHEPSPLDIIGVCKLKRVASHVVRKLTLKIGLVITCDTRPWEQPLWMSRIGKERVDNAKAILIQSPIVLWSFDVFSSMKECRKVCKLVQSRLLESSWGPNGRLLKAVEGLLKALGRLLAGSCEALGRLLEPSRRHLGQRMS